MSLQFLKHYKLFGIYALLLLGIFMTSRLLLVATYGVSLDLPLLLYGMRMDIIAISTLLLLPILLYTVNLILLSRLLMSIFLFVVLYLEIANYFFFEEFQCRLNYLFVQYIEYPKEVWDMIVASYGWVLLVVIPTLLYLGYRFFRYSQKHLHASKIVPKLYALPLILALLFLGIRSSLDSSTPNQSFYSHSNSTLSNEITNNTLFSLGYSIYLKAKEKMPNFGEKPTNPIVAIQKLEGLTYEDNLSLRHVQTSTFTPKQKILLMLMESFGHTHVGIQGGTPTTPNLDAMSQEGLFASQLYSSSYRSNRGFEAVLSSLFPTYADSYLKLPKSIHHFWTVAKTLQDQGYRTIFLYGGDSKFDNMKGFALGNGFDQVIDKYDFDGDIPRYTWGVSDEALYHKALEILNRATTPTFLMTFSLSSHKPYDYPEGKIEYYKETPIKSFANAIKYSDYALGKFYRQLKKHHFFDRGMLALVGDHNAHIYGDEPIPVKEFRIPALFIASDLVPQTFNGVAHQIDIAPTLLDIAGINATIPTMGRNLLHAKRSRALIYHHRKFAYLKDDAFVLYQRNQTPEVYNYAYQQQPHNQALIDEGLAYIYGSYAIYQHQQHTNGAEQQ